MGMLMPAGIAVDRTGHLWVPDESCSPKRMSVWNAKTGEFRQEFFGGCSYSPWMWIDPENPAEAYHDNVIWNIDLEKGTWSPKSTFYRKDGADSIDIGNGGFFNPIKVFTAKNGHQYAISTMYAFGPALMMRRGDTFRPLAFFFKNRPNPVLCNRPPFAFMEDAKAYPAGKNFVWVDTNGDQRAEAAELIELASKTTSIQLSSIDPDLTLYFADGKTLSPASVATDGTPTYDYATFASMPVRGGELWRDSSRGTLYTLNRNGGNGSTEPGLAAWEPDGKLLWSHGGILPWNQCLSMTVTEPGRILGPTCPLGVAGDFTGVISYFGFGHILRNDGMYVGRIFKYSNLGEMGADVLFIEFLAGQLVKPKGMNRYFLLGGDQDCRVTEILGLDTIRDLSGGAYAITPENEAAVRTAMADFAKTSQASRPLYLVRGGMNGLKNTEPLTKRIDEARSFSIKTAYDEKNIYCEYDVKSPYPLVNNMPDPTFIFKGGNLIDLSFGAAHADRARKTPAPGDMRVLVSQRDGKPYAVLFEPRVAGFEGERITLTSPTGQESFDRIRKTDRIGVDVKAVPGGFVARITIPWDEIGLTVAPGDSVRMDMGYIFGNETGTKAAQRAYWFNNSFTAHVVNDIPHESRLEPAEWGDVRVE